MDYGKLRYEKAKREKGKSRSSHLKEIKLRPLTAEHDVNLLQEIIEKIKDIGVVEVPPKLQEKYMSMLIVPK